jgi:hypothetical protein
VIASGHVLGAPNIFFPQGSTMFRYAVCISWSCACLGLFLGTGLSSAAPEKKAKVPEKKAKPPEKKAKPAVSDDGKELPDEKGTEYLQKEFKKVEKDFFNLIKNGNNPTGKGDDKTVRTAAQWYTYRVSWNIIQEPPEKKSLGNLKTVHEQYHNVLRDAEKANPKFMELFTRRLMQSLREVMDKGNFQAKINAALMLPRLGQTGRHELIDAMLGILNNPEYHEALKLYAIKALGELFQKPYPVPEDAKDLEKRTKRFTDTYEALLSYIDPKLNIQTSTRPAEARRIQKVARFFRREAIRALGQMRLSALSVTKNGKVEGPIAFHLARVLEGKSPSGKEMVPAPRLPEQVEAAVALCDIRGPAKSPYQGELAIYLVGRFVQTNLAKEYNSDWSKWGSISVKKKRRTDDKPAGEVSVTPPRAEPWKLHANRLERALDELAEVTRNQKELRLLRELKNKTADIFKQMKDSKQIDKDKIDLLGQHLDSNKPKDNLLFRDVKETQVSLTTVRDE